MITGIGPVTGSGNRVQAPAIGIASNAAITITVDMVVTADLSLLQRSTFITRGISAKGQVSIAGGALLKTQSLNHQGTVSVAPGGTVMTQGLPLTGTASLLGGPTTTSQRLTADETSSLASGVNITTQASTAEGTITFAGEANITTEGLTIEGAVSLTGSIWLTTDLITFNAETSLSIKATGKALPKVHMKSVESESLLKSVSLEISGQPFTNDELKGLNHQLMNVPTSALCDHLLTGLKISDTTHFKAICQQGTGNGRALADEKDQGTSVVIQGIPSPADETKSNVGLIAGVTAGSVVLVVVIIVVVVVVVNKRKDGSNEDQAEA
jgi:hypothetical protein